MEILIKNGELPPSAAQDPATPTTPGRSLPQGLIFTPSVNSGTTDNPSSPPAPPPPPPPPPMPLSSFSVTLPTEMPMQFTASDSLDFLLSGTEEQRASISNFEQTTPAIDLKELGLDIDALDSMDFGQLDCGDLGVKMDSSNILDSPSIDMDITDTPVKSAEMQNCELMDIGEMPMDMDDADWLESLMPSSQTTNGGIDNTSEIGLSHQSIFHLPSSTSTSCNYFNHNSDELDSYDPLLSNSQDPFDLFNIEDPEFKISGDMNTTLGWDKVDFAT